MTDKELIRAYREHCETNPLCVGCPVTAPDEDCEVYAKTNVEYLMNRLEALIDENEHLREVTKMVWCDAEHEVPVAENQCVLALVSGMYENLEKHSAIGFHNACEIATYNDRDGWILEQWPEWENPGVTYWMPLPEPPSTEGVERMSKCDTCKHKADDDGWMFCDRCIHSPELEDMCKPVTNADHIRAMSNFELMEFLWRLDSRDLGEVIKFCGKSHVCDELDVDEITEGMCQRCLLAKLQQP